MTKFRRMKIDVTSGRDRSFTRA
ncbi:hypothetical protein SMJ63A_220003 [Stenotrophomonas geniculata]